MASKRNTTNFTHRILTAPFPRAVVPHQFISYLTLIRQLRPGLQTQAITFCGAIRHHSRPPSSHKSTVYTFKDVKSFSRNPSPNRIIIDVREPGEFRGGAIPTAINLPITSAPEALSLPAEEFEDRFGFAKPETETEVVFYCKAGVRSSVAAQLALQNGYGKVGEYRGSWLDWEKKMNEEA